MLFNSIKKPVIGLAPMDGVTDPAFRYMIASYSSPSIIYTEFVSVDGLIRNPNKLKQNLLFSKKEKPIIAQLFGSDPILFKQAVEIILPLGFDGIDINMGCPDKDVTKRKAGAALMKDSKLTIDIINQVNIALGKNRKLSLSVKTRIKKTSKETANWVDKLCNTPIDFLCVHGRTFKQMYRGESNWDEIEKVSKIAHSYNKIILGNGDVLSYQDGINKINKYQVDGVLVGRRTFGNPWFFNKEKVEITPKQRIKALIEHIKYGQKIMPNLPFYNYRKHIGWYLRELPNASLLRVKCIKSNSLQELEKNLEV